MISPHDKALLRHVLDQTLEKKLSKEQKESFIGFTMGILEFFPQETKCSDCVNFNGGMCRLCNEMIPKDVLPSGCDSWKFDENSPPF